MAATGSRACVLPGLPLIPLGHGTHKPAGLAASIMSCHPHRWNVEDWLPLYGNPVEESDPEISCLNCGLVLAVRDTTPNMRGSIIQGIAKRVCDGDEYHEVFASASEYFVHHLTNTTPPKESASGTRTRAPEGSGDGNWFKRFGTLPEG